MTGQLLNQFISNSGYLAVRYFVLCGLLFLVFYVLFKKRLSKHKLQDSFPMRKDYWREIMYSISSTVILAFVFSLNITIFLPLTQIYTEIDAYGYGYYWLSFLLMLVLHDAYFYWTHRLIHNKRLFRTVHLVHHQSTNPTPWTSYAFHPIEAFIQALIMPIIAVAFPVHKSALIVYFLFQFLHNLYGHLGFEILPRIVRETRVGKCLNTSIIHNSHHKNLQGNFGLYFTFWDRMMGTNRV